MKKLLWFLFGIAGGFVLAHYVNKDPRGHEVLAEVDARISEFTDRIGDAYREQESRLTAAVSEAKDAAADMAAAVKDAAVDATAAVKDAAEAAAEASRPDA
ncbi:ATPase [Microbacterium elymi]|uniref:ATPase n=1 Tax=Microbacterium elymi TaxID=2909587 RepID=A0ABY5NJR3_9MICO|nr:MULTISPECIES: ATPase [Microbacterium]UUT35393.1 ATPase [Microbacterium elymi]